jgi:Uma2 family endonuclease
MSIVEHPITSLEPGDKLTREEFLRRWELLPEITTAELIGGVVYMPSPVSLDHSLMVKELLYWVIRYEKATPFCQSASNATWLMMGSVPQPDVFLRLLPEYGGQSRIDGKYPAGAPELAVEVTFSTADYDLNEKMKLYCEAGVQEYLVVLLRKREIRWHRLVDGRYQILELDAVGVLRSLVFPGLWLNVPALLRDDMNTVEATLQEGLRSPEHAEFMAKLQAKRAQ